MDSIHLTLSIVDSEYYCGYYLLWIQSLSNVDLGSIYIISRYLNRPSEVSSYHPYSPYCFVNLNPIFGKKSSGDILGDMFHCVSSPVCLGQVLTIGATGTAAIAAPRGQPGAAGAAGTTQAGFMADLGVPRSTSRHCHHQKIRCHQMLKKFRF